VTAVQPSTPLVTDQSEVDAIAASIEEGREFALDLEFMTEGRYIAELSLVQVAWGDPGAPNVAAIDPLRVDVGRLARLTGDERV
jgi:ribonuclease D